MVEVDESLVGKEFLKLAFEHCIKCGTCKMGYKSFKPSCPSGEKFLFESYWASGRIRTAIGILLEELQWSEELKNSIFACTTCGACMDSCQAPHAHYIVDIIESLRELAVQNIGPGPNQENLVERTNNPEMWNPYGVPNSTNAELKEKYNLPDKAEWVYYIGCTSNYRQTKIRDATIRLLKRAGINFTLIDEHCCTSPMLRTGQISSARDFMNYNIEKIKEVGADKLVTSCAGCYRTFIKDFEKHGANFDFEVYHTVELLKDLLDSGKMKIKSKYNKTITYHDPCHLGRHMGIYEIPREIYKQIPGVKLVEMKRNRNFAWCCGAGGGVKIGYPEWALEVSNERLAHAREVGAEVISSVCPFCRTNLSDANENYNGGFEILDLLEILDTLDIEFK
ncbi:MAG: CoB--CoM heterodisulfide reductase iron-sulfur subunit D [Promethearchaeota archaeon]|nr:MAG: CoB--CoM heterodisulfide reductase iron-sulfur subunit D [Candidatus Lokiarchaeota archaeon]